MLLGSPQFWGLSDKFFYDHFIPVNSTAIIIGAAAEKPFWIVVFLQTRQVTVIFPLAVL